MKKKLIESISDSVNLAHCESTNGVFRTAYCIAQNVIPFSDHFGPSLLDLQKLNSVNIGVSLHSQISAINLIEHVLRVMKVRFLKQFKNVCKKISVLIDESTSLSSKSALIIYLKCKLIKKTN